MSAFSTFAIPSHRCFYLRCSYATGMPSSMAAIECKGGCGIPFCSMDCMDSHHEYGHRYACPHIRKSKANDNHRQQQQQETPEQTALAEAMIQQNESWPAVVFMGKASTRRFRPGQRILASVDTGLRPGTIVNLAFRPTEHQILAYEMESDTGIYCSASQDTDDFVRRHEGFPVIVDEERLPVREDMLPGVISEFRNWMPCCQEARAGGAEASSLKGPPTLDKYRCASCGRTSTTRLQICTRCRTVAYCNVACQRNNWKEHKGACKAVAKSREEFLEKYGNTGTKRERKKVLRHASRSQLQWETLQTFLVETGLPWGGAEFLRNAVDKAARASESPDAALAIRQLVESDYEGSDLGQMMSEIVITSDNLVRLVAAVLHFFVKAPDIATYCAAGVDLFFEVSRIRPLQPLKDMKTNEDDMPEEFKEAMHQKREKKKSAKRSNRRK